MNDIIKYLCTPYWKMRYRKNLHRYKCCNIVCEIPVPLPINTTPPELFTSPIVWEAIDYSDGIWENCLSVTVTLEISVDGITYTPYTEENIQEEDIGSYIRVKETCGSVIVYSAPIGPIAGI